MAEQPAGTSPGVCLLTPEPLADEGSDGFAEALNHPLVEVVILTAGTQAATSKARLKDLRERVARHGKVFLVEDDVALAVELEAEGTLVGKPDGIAVTREAVGSEAMVGVRAGLSRHAAMSAAEAGADFVALSAGENAEGDMDDLLDHVAWWSELFEVASVAFGAASPEEAASLAGAGADFLALGEPLWRQTGAAAAVLGALDTRDGSGQ